MAVLLLVSGCGSTSSATKGTSRPAAFKYYDAVNIGMTKDQVESATGLKRALDTTGYALENTYYFKDASGKYGVCIVFNKDMKAYSKTVVYPDAAEALAPQTVKAVTADQVDRITDGMSHADVDNLLGGAGIECSVTVNATDLKSPVGTVFRWGNKDGTFIQIPFSSSDRAHLAIFFK